MEGEMILKVYRSVVEALAVSVAVVTFFSKFRFRPEVEGKLGVELEFFLVDDHGKAVPASREFLDVIQDKRWTYELSACQVEARTGIKDSVSDAIVEIKELIEQGRRTAESLGYRLVAVPVFPDPDMTHAHYVCERYDRIVSQMPEHVLDACVRVAGIHVHVGCKDRQQGLLVYKRLRAAMPRLLAMGDLSNRQRIILFKILSNNLNPPDFKTWLNVLHHAISDGWVLDFGQCWSWLRLHEVGSNEVRVFDATDDIKLIESWLYEVCEIAQVSA